MARCIALRRIPVPNYCCGRAGRHLLPLLPGRLSASSPRSPGRGPRPPGSAQPAASARACRFVASRSPPRALRGAVRASSCARCRCVTARASAVGGIGARHRRQVQEHADHLRHLVLSPRARRPATVSFTRAGRILRDLQPGARAYQQRHPARMPELRRCLRVLVKEQRLHAWPPRAGARSPRSPAPARSRPGDRRLGASVSVSMTPWATCRRRSPSFTTTPQPKCRVPGSIPRTRMSQAPPPRPLHLLVGDVEVGVDLLHIVVVVEGVGRG